MTALSLVASGWVASFFVGFTTSMASLGAGLGPSLVYTTLISALIGGLALRSILPLLTGVEIGYARAVAAVGLGGLAGAIFTSAIQGAMVHHAPTVAPVIWSSPLVLLGTTGVSLLVSYSVITAGGMASRRETAAADAAAVAAAPSAWREQGVKRPASRGSEIFWVPAILVGALAALAFLRPWQHLGLGSGPSLPSLPSLTTQDSTKGAKMSAARLAAMLDAGTLRWRCVADSGGAFDYVCSQAQLREVKGFDVNNSQIVQTKTLVYAGQELTSP